MRRLPPGLALVGGGLFALQSHVNGELAARAGSALWAALVSFSSGFVVLCVLVPAVPPLRRAARRALADRLPWWAYTGGIAGGTLVAVSAVAVPRVGVATFTVGVVAGQAAGGLVVDRSRLGSGDPRPLTANRLVGAALAVLAVAVIRFDHGGATVGGGVLVVLLLASALAGAWSSVQQALNGRVQRATGAPLLAAWVNFATGTVWLALLFALAAPAGAGPDRLWPPGAWLYVGGLLGIAFIANAAWLVHALGVLRLGLLTVAGQLAGGVGLDLISPGPAGRPGVATYVAVLLTLVAVVVAGSHSRSRRRTSSIDIPTNATT